MNLSLKQKEIVEHINGAILVNAGPGSGKTRVLTERVKHLLTVSKRGKVLALTFSNMAAEEMRSRLDNDPDVGETIERATISTIHSFCLDIIQSRGYLIGIRPDVSLFENEIDRIAILRSVFNGGSNYEISLNEQTNPEMFLTRCLLVISEQKRSLISPDLCDIEAPFPQIYQKYNDILRSHNAMDFDDILFFAYRILVENLDIIKLYNSVYRYICIDESQDLNNAQYRVIQALCSIDFRNIMMVGDANQSIYAFNGSSNKYMQECFVTDFNPQVYTLDENFRSAKQIIHFANNVLGNIVDVSHYYYDGEVLISECVNETAEALSVRDKIDTLLVKGHRDIEHPLTYKDIAIIARNKYVFSEIEREFADSGIPFYYKKTQSGISFETDYIEAFDLILRLIMNPMDLFHRQLLCKLLSTSLPSNDTGSDIKEQIEYILTAQEKFSWLISSLPNISNSGILNFDKVLDCLNMSIPDSLSDEEKYLLKADINEWHKHWTKFIRQNSRDRWSLVSFRNAISLGKTQEKEEETGVTLLTAHMSKGLEFEVVFIIGLTEGTFPDYRAVNGNEDAMTQEKNNMYDAVTRAKRLCYLSYPKEKCMQWGAVKKQNPSRFIYNQSNNVYLAQICVL